ncbi:hypothetical protein [uncultured Chryseobacterium sp.]|uniref:hypothetical protein n=1 Tax=uncultured Chryseobacterium sp. TaxID=259322 RepID=UPI00258DD32A|nr:hypothetical protein [uncultured Chryseobacterium sp.]
MPDKNIITNNEQSSTKERLLKYIESKHLNSNQFLEMAGLSKTYISNMRQSIKPSTFDNNIAPAFPDLNKIWLLYGEGEMLLDKQEAQINKTTSPIFKDLPIGEQLNLLHQEIADLKSELKKEREENARNTEKIIDFVDEYFKPVFDFMTETMKTKKKG